MDVQELYEWKLLEKEIDDCDDFVEVLNTLLAFGNFHDMKPYIEGFIGSYQGRIKKAKRELKNEGQ